MIDLFPNGTVLCQWLIFMSVLLTLTVGVFRPVLRILEERRDRITGERADRFRRQAEELVSVCEQRLEAARRAGIQDKETRRQEAEKRRSEILKAARGEIEQRMNQIQGEIEQVSREASLKLRQYSQELGREIATKVLEREI